MAKSFEAPNPYSGAFPPPPPPAAQPSTPPAGRSHPAVRAALVGGLVAAVVAGGVGFTAGRVGSEAPGPRSRPGSSEQPRRR